jgi:glutamate-1-semialdehyde 2,1-aminomutase
VAGSDLLHLFEKTFAASAEQAEKARTIFPNGVTHDARHLDPFPVFVDSVDGCRKQTIEGRTLIDFWMGHGALLLGHNHPDVVEAVQRQMSRGTHYSASHILECKWGQLVLDLVPSGEKLRFTNSGTEATLMALRIARIATGRPKVLKFSGHFHGWHDQLILAQEAGSNADWKEPGVTDDVCENLVVVPPNDVEALRAAIERHRPACVILEPTGGHWGQVPVRGPFLRDLRNVTQETRTLLIFDEVITGFRVAPGGAQEAYGVTPDLTTLAKVLAGGLPGGALTGRAELMNYLEFDHPSGQKMRHPGTYNGNPLSAAAGISALKQVATGEPCRLANEQSAYFRAELNRVFREQNVNWAAYGDFSLTKILPNYTGTLPEDDDFLPYENDTNAIARPIDPELTRAFRWATLLNGVDLMGWGAIMSSAHTNADLDRAVEGISSAIDRLRENAVIR